MSDNVIDEPIDMELDEIDLNQPEEQNDQVQNAPNGENQPANVVPVVQGRLKKVLLILASENP